MTNLIDGIIISCSGFELSQNEISFFKNINPLGFVLFKRNFRNKDQIKKLIKHLKEITHNNNLLIFIDQEGGRVQRLDNNEFTKFSPQKLFGDIYIKDKDLAVNLTYKSAYLMGFELKEIGVDVNFSPVCDLMHKNSHKVIGNRSFGSDPKMVLQLSDVFCSGLEDAGIIPVPKHFPGHGRSVNDTHLETSTINSELVELEKTDFIPFNFLHKSLIVMLAHITYTSIDKRVATYSKKIIKNFLREKFKFKGLVLSDDISMKGISGSLTEKVENSYNAGCDVVLYCHGILDELKKIYPSVREINKDSMEFFLSKSKKIKFKKKNFRKYRSDLINCKLISETNAT